MTRNINNKGYLVDLNSRTNGLKIPNLKTEKAVLAGWRGRKLCAKGVQLLMPCYLIMQSNRVTTDFKEASKFVGLNRSAITGTLFSESYLVGKY